MKIENVRFGLATNSSSSHSVIFSSTPQKDVDFGEYDWNFFTCASDDNKKLYLATTLVQNLSRTLPESMINAVLKGLNLLTNKEKEVLYEDAFIDHQSLYNIPYEYGTQTPSLEFFNDLQKYLMRDGVVIVGGNDNTEKVHKLVKSKSTKRLELDYKQDTERSSICRKDGDWWVVFNPENGARIVFSFEESPKPYVAKAPMLIDLKITDYCSHGCAYCYQGSSKQGEHCKDIYNVYNYISENEVFEVAIGGGEPTEHPKFVDFLRSVRAYGAVPNFTTKSTKWLEDVKTTDKVIDLVGAFAISVDGKTDMSILDRVVDIFKYREYSLFKLTLQIVPAVMREYEISRVLTWASKNSIRVTLLGFKTTGRGEEFKIKNSKNLYNKFDESQFLSVLSKLYKDGKLGVISIDTTLANLYSDKLEAIGLPSWLYRTKEGEVSMYIDAVTNKAGASSYAPETMVDFDIDVFEKIRC